MTTQNAARALQGKVMLAMGFAAALSILLTRQTGTDYLYYYLPLAEYFTWRGLPTNVSLSIIDAPFAYPRAESLLLALTSVFGEYRIYAIKLLQCLKIGALFWLALRIAALRENSFFLTAALVAPSMLAYLSIYSTDINAAVGALALLLIYLGEKRTLLLWLLVGFAAATSYTFWVLLFPFYIVLFRHGRLGLNGLIPAVLILLHLLTNFHYYGNPVYPLGEQVSPSFPAELRTFIGAWFRYDIAKHWIPEAGAGFLAGGGLFFLAARIPAPLLAVLAVYVTAWLFGMLFSSSGETGRFLLPAALIAACFVGEERFHLRGLRLYAALVAVAILCAAFVVNYSWPYRFALCAYLATCVLIYRGGAWRNAGLAIALLASVAYAGAKIYAKPDISRDLGYGAYEGQISYIDEKSKSAIVFTDWRILPHAVRVKANVVLWWSEVYSPIPRQVALSGRYDCAGKGLHVVGSAAFLQIARKFNYQNCAFVEYRDMEP